MYAHDVDFGSELFALRRRKGATQAEVAYKAGIGRGYYSELENSKKGPPSVKRLKRIVDALELSDVEAQRLVSVAVADKCATACQSIAVLAHVSLLVKYLVQSATALSGEKAARIEAILQED
jgi:transcriptional regulator with XRE-family HTH domain